MGASNKSGDVLKKGWVVVPQCFKKSVNIKPRATIVPKGVQGRSQASKSLPKAPKMTEQGVANRHPTPQELIKKSTRKASMKSKNSKNSTRTKDHLTPPIAVTRKGTVAGLRQPWIYIYIYIIYHIYIYNIHNI